MSLLYAAVRQISDNKHKQVPTPSLSLRKLRHVAALMVLLRRIVI